MIEKEIEIIKKKLEFIAYHSKHIALKAGLLLTCKDESVNEMLIDTIDRYISECRDSFDFIIFQSLPMLNDLALFSISNEDKELIDSIIESDPYSCGHTRILICDDCDASWKDSAYECCPVCGSGSNYDAGYNGNEYRIFFHS